MQPIQLFSQICHRDIRMAIACFKSLESSWQQGWTLNLIEDGSVTEEDWGQLRTAFPNAVFYPKYGIRGRIEEALQKHLHCLHFYRENVLAPKLFEVPFLSGEEVYYSDADLLFFRKIKRLFPATCEVLFLLERATAFSGFSHSVFHWAFRHRIPLAENINTGIFRFPKAVYDLDKIEWFLKRAQNPRNSFLIEQTCWSFLFAEVSHSLVDSRDILCTKEQLSCENLPLAIHFIADQKKVFWDFIPETEKHTGIQPVDELRTIPGRRVSMAQIGGHVARGIDRRLGMGLFSRLTG